MKIALLLLAAVPAIAGPLEFAMSEFNRAVTERGLPSGSIHFQTEVEPGVPESYRIAPGKISGGDVRGLMYGVLEAADQVRETGRVHSGDGAPQTPIRGIRYFIHNHDLDETWYYSREYWDAYFTMLARERFNRFNLVFAHQTAYLAPPYPFWLQLPEFPGIRAAGLTDAQRQRNLAMLQYISQAAADHGIDFTLGVWEHNIQTGMKPSVEGLTRENIGPYSYAALKKILELCPAITSVQMRTNRESGIPDDQEVEFYRDYVFKAIKDAPRPVLLDLRAWIVAGGMISAAEKIGIPLRVSTKYWAEDLGRPYQPAETYPGYSYLNFLPNRRTYDFYFELWGLGSNRLLLWGSPEYVRRAVSTFGLGGAKGFEIDPPLAQKGFGNRPGRWGVFTEAQKDRAFWKWEFERYWLFYRLWGRLSYNPATPDHVWMDELKRRFGKAAPDVIDAYTNASQVVNEIVAAHLADPNMYIWPEINPGGLIDSYEEVLPSDWRYIASIPETVHNRLAQIASAKATPFDTSARLDEIAERVEQAIHRANKTIKETNAEWRSTEADLTVLSLMARYHARKQIAALNVAWFDATGNESSLAAAKHELAAALEIWERLVKFTDGLYPAEMSFGPDDIGHWKDKLPYVRYDLDRVREREETYHRFGRFDFGFDFGAPVEKSRGASYRSTPFVRDNNVEPRFTPVDPATRYNPAAGFGWAADGEREAVGIPLTPYHEVRAVTKNPAGLPHDSLFRDFIRGKGSQQFLVKTGPGEFTVSLLHPDGSATESRLIAADGLLTIPFSGQTWSISGLVIKGPARAAPAALTPPARLARPAISHISPKTAVADEPLSLKLHVKGSEVTSVRLHYRAVNQLARFKMMEAAPGETTFTIPASDVSAEWDLMYYFEILNKDNSGWFEPDPLVKTPYYVVKTVAGNAVKTDR